MSGLATPPRPATSPERTAPLGISTDSAEHNPNFTTVTAPTDGISTDSAEHNPNFTTVVRTPVAGS